MLPTSFYNWLSDRNWTWFGLRRLRPAPNQNYPWLALLIFPVLTGIFIGALAVGISWLMRNAGGDADAGFTSLIVIPLAVLGFTGSLVHRTFALLSWNQRAARIRTAGAGDERPGPGALTRWILGPTYVLIIAVVVPLLLLVALENVRGAWRWRAVRTQLTAQGERLLLHEVAPALPPAELNFFSIPPFSDLIRTDPPGAMNTNAEAAFRVLAVPSQTTRRARGDRTPLTLTEWADSFRVAISNQASVTDTSKSSVPSLRYPEPAAGADDATVVLTALSRAEPLLNSFCDASQRTRAVFPIRWEEGFNALLPHLTRLKGIQQLLDVRVAALLSRGESNRAFAETECALRFASLLREEPLLISQLVRLAQVTIATQTVWRGIAAHAWTEPQLATLQEQLSSLSLLSAYAMAMEGERGGANALFNQWVTTGGYPQGGGSSPTFLPSGWIRQNQATINLFYQDRIQQGRRAASNPPPGGLGPVLHDSSESLRVFLDRERRWSSPYNVFVRMLLPAVDRAFEKFVQAEASVLSAVTGCALERYRLRHGSYPATLDLLVPDFLAQIPLDPINHQPLRYARTDDGLFRLWSVGLNGIDDGGIFLSEAKSESGNLDWPWPYQMP